MALVQFPLATVVRGAPGQAQFPVLKFEEDVTYLQARRLGRAIACSKISPD
jgi:hypothetical protein